MISYRYRIYDNRRIAHLDKMLEEAAYTWNRALAIQRRYYSMYHKHILCSRMKAHFTKRKTRVLLNCCTMQEILERQELAFVAFFSKKAKRPPKFKKAKDFRTIVFKRGIGYTLYGNELIIHKISKRFKFALSRPFDGTIKQVRITRTPTHKYFINIITDAVPQKLRKTHNGASVGMDFGLKQFLTLSDGRHIDYPRFLEKEVKKIALLDRKNSKSPSKTKRMMINRQYEATVNKRSDWQWKLAHELCRSYDNIYIEDLNILGMGRMSRWGRKVYDYAFSRFVETLGYVSSKYGVSVKKINRVYPSSKTCSVCGYLYKQLSLHERCWVCPQCGTTLDRDINAANNIMRQGIVSSESVRKSGSLAGSDRILQSANAEYVKAVEIPNNNK